LRGLARWHEDQPLAGNRLDQLLGAGRLVLTLQNDDAEPYQGIVGLKGDNLAEAIENYFNRSEQLATRLWLAADGERAVGLFLQELPSFGDSQEDWQRISLLAGTVTERELLLLPGEELLYRLFSEEAVRLFEPEPVSFRCTCSRERVESVLRSMGREELEEGLQQQGELDVNCEFCNRRYRFDAVDVQALLAVGIPPAGPRTRH
jgi:molecular chaperone Hsp33